MAGLRKRLGSGGEDHGKYGFELFTMNFFVDVDNVRSLGSIRGTIYLSRVRTDNLYAH